MDERVQHTIPHVGRIGSYVIVNKYLHSTALAASNNTRICTTLNQTSLANWPLQIIKCRINSDQHSLKPAHTDGQLMRNRTEQIQYIKIELCDASRRGPGEPGVCA